MNLTPYQQWMVQSNLKTIAEGTNVAVQTALLEANGYPVVAEAVREAWAKIEAEKENMEQTEVHSAEEARDKAAAWQHWMADRSLSYGEIVEWQDYFTKMADQFGLTDEFKENGII